MKLRLILGLLILLVTHIRGFAAFTPIGDVFAGTNGSQTSLTASAGVLAGSTSSGNLGGGYGGTVSLPAGLLYATKLDINGGNNGALTFAGTGVLGAAATWSASKTFTGDTFDPGTAYSFTLTRQAGAVLSLLSSFNVAIYSGTTLVANTATGAGLLGGTLNLLSLFGTSNTASFQFTTGAGISPTQPIEFVFSGATAAGLAGQSLVLSGGSLTQVAAVPEPSTTAFLLGAGLLGGGVALRRRAPRPLPVRARR
jgi:hypothetical protein